MLYYIHSSPLTPIKTIEVSYGCYWTGLSSYGPISSSCLAGLRGSHVSLDDLPSFS